MLNLCISLLSQGNKIEKKITTGLLIIHKIKICTGKHLPKVLKMYPRVVIPLYIKIRNYLGNSEIYSELHIMFIE